MACIADLLISLVVTPNGKSRKGQLSPAQQAFRDAVQAQGFGWALVRSLDDALGALADHGLTTRVVGAVGSPALGVSGSRPCSGRASS